LLNQRPRNLELRALGGVYPCVAGVRDSHWLWVLGLGLSLSSSGCPDEEPPGEGATEAASGESGIDPSAASNTEGTSDSTGSNVDETGTTPTGGTASGGCGTDVLACSDGMDNDGDGLIDSDDPECTGACDDDEASFQTGIPGDNMDCKQDCFFDGNSGQGDDGCNWNLRCDPENPGEGIGCEYTGGNNCEQQPVQTPECIDFCASLTPNGCDCFGCCQVSTPDGDVYVYLGSGPDCSLTNLDACNSCTQSDDCGNPCESDGCEVCFGETEPEEGCGEPDCPEDQIPCTSDGEGGSDCPEGLYCLTGCCIDFTPES
jgi:hypothetical protein